MQPIKLESYKENRKLPNITSAPPAELLSENRSRGGCGYPELIIPKQISALCSKMAGNKAKDQASALAVPRATYQNSALHIAAVLKRAGGIMRAVRKR